MLMNLTYIKIQREVISFELLYLTVGVGGLATLTCANLIVLLFCS